jgi:methionyl-tRNA synthetase
MLALKPLKWHNAGSTDIIMEGHQISQSELLFEKIEDEQIQFQTDKLRNTKIANEKNQVIASEPLKEDITYEDFSRLDIRIATIQAVEKVAKTKKLLKLTLDTGVEMRTVVSGIAEYYEPDEIVGKQVVFLANLKPKEIKGIESHGMILTASHANGTLALIHPDKVINNGGIIS